MSIVTHKKNCPSKQRGVGFPTAKEVWELKQRRKAGNIRQLPTT